MNGKAFYWRCDSSDGSVSERCSKDYDSFDNAYRSMMKSAISKLNHHFDDEIESDVLPKGIRYSIRFLNDKIIIDSSYGKYIYKIFYS